MTGSHGAAADDASFRRGSEIEAVQVRGLEAEGRDLRDMRVLDSTISHSNLRGADLSDSELDHVRFESCDLAGAIWAGTRFEEVEFVECNLTGIDWTQAHWSSLCLPAPIAFQRSRLDLSSFFGLSLKELSIEGGSATETDFSEADLQQATIRGVELQGAIFNSTDLRDAHLEGSVDYLIHPRNNRIDRCSVSFPGATSFLVTLGLEVVDPPSSIPGDTCGGEPRGEAPQRPARAEAPAEAAQGGASGTGIAPLDLSAPPLSERRPPGTAAGTVRGHDRHALDR